MPDENWECSKNCAKMQSSAAKSRSALAFFVTNCNSAEDAQVNDRLRGLEADRLEENSCSLAASSSNHTALEVGEREESEEYVGLEGKTELGSRGVLPL